MQVMFVHDCVPSALLFSDWMYLKMTPQKTRKKVPVKCCATLYYNSATL